MIPTENEHNSGEQKREITHSHRKRHKRHRKHKKTLFERFVKTIKTNPLKILAPFFLCFLVFLTILFFVYDDGEKVLKENLKNSKTTKQLPGILLPNNVINGSKTVIVNFGSRTENISSHNLGVSVPLEKLRQGFAISPMDKITCGNQGMVGDSSKFNLILEGNKLFVSADFKTLLNDEIAGSIDKKYWTFISKDISQFYSDDNLFEVIDSQGYIIFSMQFAQPDKIVIRGYFVGERCIYIAGEDGLYAQPKEGNYVEKASAQIRKIERTYSSK